MRRPRSALLLVSLLAGLLPAAAAPALAGDSAGARHARTVAYWTPARMAAAVPRDFVRDGGPFRPVARPGSGSNVGGASWTNGGAILRASGKVFFSLGSNNYTCSGSVASDSRSGHSLVLTAAHCAYDEVARRFATNWLFIPEWDSAPTRTCSATKWGCWSAQALVVHNGYATAGGFNTQATLHDFAFAVVAGGGKSGTTQQLDATVGSFGITFNAFADGTRMYAFGYPAQGRYKGNDLTYCAGPVFSDPYNDELTYGMTCNMTGGSSGGPWLSSFSESTGSGTLSSLNSYGYSGVNAMHGPKFNSDTRDVYTTANSNTTTANAIVP